MKRFTTLFVIALAMVFMAASCQKDGVFNPQKKVTHVFKTVSHKIEEYYDGAWHTTSGTEADEYLCETWEWDGNLLKSISYYDADGSARGKEVFRYDGKRLATVAEDDDTYYEFFYDGNKLSSINCVYDKEVVESYGFTYDGKHISEMSCTDYDVDYKGKALSPAILRHILPTAEPATMEKMAAHMKAAIDKKDITTYKIKFEWDGNNISKMVEEYGPASSYAVTYSYDNKINPFKGLFNIFELGVSEMFSKNNVTLETEVDGEYIDINTYEYTYNGKYPETKSYTHSYEYDDYRSITSYKYRYQYK